ncbi:MAG: MAPEG family protein [Pseudomonadota bacterium]
MSFETTAIYAGLMILWSLALTVAVIRQRRALRVSLGDGGHDDLARIVRAHGNAAETVPLALIGLALAEAMGTPGWILHLLGLGLVAGRVLHGLHFLQGRRDATWRVAGMGLTLTVLGILGIGLLAHGLADLA